LIRSGCLWAEALCSPPSGCPSRVVGRGVSDGLYLWGGEGLEPVQTFVPIAVNSGKDPEVIDAAACTFLHEGRIVDLRCARKLKWAT
jgi:hypothetical protein